MKDFSTRIQREAGATTARERLSHFTMRVSTTLWQRQMVINQSGEGRRAYIDLTWVVQ